MAAFGYHVSKLLSFEITHVRNLFVECDNGYKRTKLLLAANYGGEAVCQGEDKADFRCIENIGLFKFTYDFTFLDQDKLTSS